jgi:hypothetical protein
VTKLSALPAGAKPSVTIDTIEPSATVKVTDKESLSAVLTEQLGRGTKALAMLRVTDGEDVFTRAIYVPFKVDDGKYLPDVNKALTDLYKNNIFKGVPNEDLFAGMTDGSVVVESIPGYRMSFAGDASKDDNVAFKLVNDVKNGKTERYAMIFGQDANRFAKVILPGLARTDDISGFSPINIIADVPGTCLASEFKTKFVQPSVSPLPAPLPVEPSEVVSDFSVLDHVMTDPEPEAEPEAEPWSTPNP